MDGKISKQNKNFKGEINGFWVYACIFLIFFLNFQKNFLGMSSRFLNHFELFAHFGLPQKTRLYRNWTSIFWNDGSKGSKLESTFGLGGW